MYMELGGKTKRDTLWAAMAIIGFDLSIVWAAIQIL